MVPFAQRVSPFWSPLLLQSPTSRTGLAPQANTQISLENKAFFGDLEGAQAEFFGVFSPNRRILSKA
jgi:hypothetical protein